MNWSWPQLLMLSMLAARVVFCIVRDGKEYKVDGGAVTTGTLIHGAILYAGGFWSLHP